MSRWTSEEDAEARRLMAEGVSLRQISVSLGRGRNALRDRLRNLREATQRPARPGNRWTSADDSYICKAVQSGLTDEQMAASLGRSQKSVAIRRLQLGILRPRGCPRSVAIPPYRREPRYPSVWAYAQGMQA